MILFIDIWECRDTVSYFFCFKQKTADEMRISDWSSDVCSSDLSERRTLTSIGIKISDAMERARLHEALERKVGERTRALTAEEIGRASCRERVCQSV